MSKPLLKSEKEVLLAQLKSEKAVLKALEKHYQEAIKGINARIAELLGRNDANLPHVIRRVEYQRMIKQQVKAALDMLHAKEYETISAYLDDAYEAAFVGAAYTQHDQGMPVIVAIDQNAVIKAITIDTKLKASLYESLGVDVTKLKKTITNEITRGIASGMLFDDISRNIANASLIPMKRARTIVRTEAGRVMEQATFDEAVKAKKAGADVVKQWSAIRDGKTRRSHQYLDGQVRELDEPFETQDGHKAMHPHGFGIAKEDCNCRCTMLTRARSALDEDELTKLKERAKFFGLDKSDELETFKKKYLKAAETLEKQGKSGIIKVDKIIDGHASTPKQYEPNSVIDHIGKGGAVNVRSFYGDNGMKVKDIHTDDHGYPKQHEYGSHGEHAHDYEWDADGRLKNKTTREISQEERERSGDIL